MPAAVPTSTTSPAAAPVQPAHRTRQATRKIMNDYTQMFNAQPSAKGAFGASPLPLSGEREPPENGEN